MGPHKDKHEVAAQYFEDLRCAGNSLSHYLAGTLAGGVWPNRRRGRGRPAQFRSLDHLPDPKFRTEIIWQTRRSFEAPFPGPNDAAHCSHIFAGWKPDTCLPLGPPTVLSLASSFPIRRSSLALAQGPV